MHPLSILEGWLIVFLVAAVAKSAHLDSTHEGESSNISQVGWKDFNEREVRPHRRHRRYRHRVHENADSTNQAELEPLITQIHEVIGLAF